MLQVCLSMYDLFCGHHALKDYASWTVRKTLKATTYVLFKDLERDLRNSYHLVAILVRSRKFDCNIVNLFQHHCC